MVAPRLAAAVDGLAPAALSGEAFRHVAENRHPLSGAGARSLGGRWNPRESFATLYLALERETVVREFFRLARRMGLAPEDFLPRRFYRYSFELSGLLDLREAEARAAVGLSERSIASDDLGPCQAVGEAAHYLGREGVVAPSATGAGTVLAVFFDRLTAGSFVHDLDYETWESPPSPPER
ncbi:MAG: RES family NAD+ phosphorylase [Thermoleophilaceae bacterium]